MQLATLQKWVAERDGWEYQMDKTGIVVLNKEHQAAVHLTFDAVARLSLAEIEAACKDGRDVDHITRVTGYFSKTSGWNKGKMAELKDRHKTTADES